MVIWFNTTIIKNTNYIYYIFLFNYILKWGNKELYFLVILLMELFQQEIQKEGTGSCNQLKNFLSNTFIKFNYEYYLIF